jgi:enoyl-CoA hydratase
MEQVVIERDGVVAVVRLNRPPANAIDLAFAEALEGAFGAIGSSDARALVVTGTGGAFSAGLDLKLVPRYGPAEQRAMLAVANRMLARLYAWPVPVVAAVNGHAIAAGLIVALACDYRVATAAPCKLGLTEARAGIPFPAAAMAILRAEVGPGVARVLTLRAENVGPEQALASGLVDELQPPDRVVPAALAVARDLATIPAAAYATIKRQLRAGTIAFVEEAARGTDPALDSWLVAGAADASAALLRRGR